MKRDPFDLVCNCDYETETHICICVNRRKFGEGRPCIHCIDGKHRMMKKPNQEIQSSGDSGDTQTKGYLKAIKGSYAPRR